MTLTHVKAGALTVSFYVAPLLAGNEITFADILAAYLAAGGAPVSPLVTLLSATYADAAEAAQAFAEQAATIHANALNADYIDCSFQSATGLTVDSDADAAVIRIAIAHSITA